MTASTVPSEPVYARARVIGGLVAAHHNELPVGPTAPVRAAMLNIAGRANRYPEPGYASLVAALAEDLQVPAETIVLGAGSDSVLQRIIRVTSSHGSEVAFTGPTHNGFALFANQVRARVAQVPPAADGTVDLDALAGATGPSTRVVVVCNPHNPTGTLTTHRALDRLVEHLDGSALLVLDEAYHGFCVTPDAPDGVAFAKACWARGRDQVVVVRTFSTSYGLAGLRVGFAVAAPTLAAEVRAAGLPAEIASTAAAAALAALNPSSGRARDIATVITERARLLHELRRLGFTVPDSHANFVWLDAGSDSGLLAKHFADHDVRVRLFDGAGLRLTIGNQADNDRILRAAYLWVLARHHATA